MRLVTLRNGKHRDPGVILGAEILNLPAAAQVIPSALCLPGSVRGILEAGETALDLLRRLGDQVQSGSGSLKSRLQDADALVPAATAKLAAPIPDPRVVLSCGMNYKAHLIEMGGKLPEAPVGFLKNANALVGPGEAIRIPSNYPNMVDWEAEFCGVIGKPCHNVSPAEALDYVVGYTMINDVSARDWVPRLMSKDLTAREAIAASEDNIHGKQFPTFCPMGYSIALKDEIADPENAHFELKLNGQVMQSASTDDLVFSVAALISHFSKIYRLLPGDVISTGSPAGVGMGRKPFIFLKPGDVVEISAAGIGTMINPVKAEDAA